MSLPKQLTTETMNVSESRKQYSELLNRVHQGEAQIIIEKNGIPLAAIVPLSVVRDAEMTERRRQNVREAFEATRKAMRGIPPDEIEREIEKALAEAKSIQLAKRLATEDTVKG